MKLFRFTEVRAQRLFYSSWKWNYPFLSTFGLANGYRVQIEIYVFHSQPKAFDEPHSGAVEQTADEPVPAVQAHQNRTHLVRAEHAWDSLRSLRPYEIFELAGWPL